MTEKSYGTILMGNKDDITRSYEKWNEQPIDHEINDNGDDAYEPQQTTLAKTVSVTGRGTFFGHAERTLSFEPSKERGWSFDRIDVPNAMPIGVSVKNVWTTTRNIVLCSGSPHNYMRMVEHIIALKMGIGLDNVVVRIDSGDPPLFERGSMDIVEKVEEAGLISKNEKVVYVTVKEPVTIGGTKGAFLTLLPAKNNSKKLMIDCSIDFKSAIGRQRISFTLNKKIFRYGALARTNTTLLMMIFCKTIGKIFADTRNLGYTSKNILIAGPRSYFNKPYLLHNGKSLEAVWHRAMMDLLAAMSLIDGGRLAGKIISHKAGHALDVQMVRQLYQHNLLKEI